MEQNNSLTISNAIKDIELIKQISARRGVSIWKIKRDGQYHVLKIAKLEKEDPTEKYNHDFRIYTLKQEVKILKELDDFTEGMYSFSGKDENAIWVATKWIEGKSVSLLARQLREENVAGNAKQGLLNLIIKVFEKTADLHDLKYIHGDIQPAHYILKEDGELSLIDFGLSKKMGEETMCKGTFLHYAAPEIAKGMLAEAENVILTQKSDIYAAASLAFILYTGKTSTYYGTYDYMSVSFKEKEC